MNKIMPDFYHLPDFEQMPVSQKVTVSSQIPTIDHKRCSVPTFKTGWQLLSNDNKIPAKVHMTEKYQMRRTCHTSKVEYELVAAPNFKRDVEDYDNPPI